ncbi:MAG TPA: exodeoxyribonuclease V subunit beta [Oleiagrimonas sp.]|nr:exodeoxyribonuclease V subunit beta [Oleiagrimonas sp.]
MSRLDDIAGNDLALTLPLDGRQLIEASAGTGKTYTIAGLYARLIVERRVPVRQLLVMTFTRAATEELRQRLRDRLALCARLANDGSFDADASAIEAMNGEEVWALTLLRRARDAGEETPEALADRLRLALASMDEAAIFTIHGFCQRVLDAHVALLDDAIAGAELVASDRDLLEDFAAETWLRVAGSDDVDELAALQQLAGSPESLATLLGDLIGFEGEIEPAAGELSAAADTDAATQALLKAWREQGAAAMDVFDEWFAAGHLNASKFKKGADGQLRQLAAVLASGRLPEVAALKRYTQAYIAGAVKKNKPDFPQQPAFAAIDDWLSAHEAVEARRQAWLPILLHRIVAEARTWLTRRKRDLARVSYDDLITRLATSVAGQGRRHHTLVKALREQYPYALVDEFQDTDARQFGILETLYGGFGTLYMIGDPKQAIYGFRGGDVHAYLRAAKGAGGKHSLPHNFRSSPAMLRAVEAVFTASEQPFVEEGIDFKHVESGGGVADDALQMDGQTVTPLTFWMPPAEVTKADDVRDVMATACARTIARLLRDARLDGQPLEPGRVAVLTGTNAEAARMQDALHACGVPAVCQRKESVFTSGEARELLRILDALLVPQSMSRARGALATELLGRHLSDLAHMAADEDAWSAALGELADLHACWFARGIAATLERLAERHAPRLLALPDGDRRLSNLLQLGELLAADGRKLAGQRALRDALAAHIRDADSQNDAEQLRLESDAQCVQIVTLHRSKGLEYDVVLMPFTGLNKLKSPSKGTCPRFHRDEESVRRLILSGSNNREADDAVACQAHCVETMAEDARTVYVGLTRAKYACWIAGGGSTLTHLLGNNGDPSALVDAHQDIMATVAPEAVKPVHLTPLEQVEPGHARRFTRHLSRDWWTHSFSQWASGARDAADAGGGAHDETIADDDVSSVDVDPGVEVPTWPRGPRYGNAVHTVLEKTDFALWRGCVDEAPKQATGLLARELRATGLGGEELTRAEPPTAKLLAAALNAPVVDKLCLADLDPADRCPEMAFHFGIAGADPEAVLASLHKHGYQTHHADYGHLGERLRGLMTGIIDLVFRHREQWWVVDYKTNNLGAHAGDYAEDKLPAAIAAHDYDLQYIIYTVALHRWLRQTLGDAYDYERDMGGVRYLFVRGMTAGGGVFADRPPRELIEALDTLLAAPMEVAA